MPSRASAEAPAPNRGAALAWDLARRVHVGSRRPANWFQLFKFGLVGASGYLLNLAVFALLFKVAHVHHLGAAVLSFCVAVTNNFVLNRTWTFRDARGAHPAFQALRFFAVSVAGLGVNLLVLYGLVDIVDAPVVPSQAIAVAVAMPFNFVGNKLWTFRDSGRRSPP
jgi:putative flippase GtrA